MSRSFGWGIVGTGKAAHRFADDIPLSAGGYLAGIASRSRDKAQTFSDRYGAPIATTDLTKLAADDAISAVYIATPNIAHKAQILEVIAAGKPVLCEKPIALSSADLEEIRVRAEANNVVVMEGFWTRMLPTFRALYAALEAGKIGTPLHLSISLGLSRVETEGDAVTDPKLGGGALFDLGLYCVGLRNTLLGRGRQVAMHGKRSDRGALRHVTVVSEHDGGATCTLEISHACQLGNAVRLTGDRATISVPAPFIRGFPGRLIPAPASGYQDEGVASPRMAQLRRTPLWPQLQAAVLTMRGDGGQTLGSRYKGTGLQYEMDEVARCVSGPGQLRPVFSLDDSLAALVDLEEIDSIR